MTRFLPLYGLLVGLCLSACGDTDKAASTSNPNDTSTASGSCNASNATATQSVALTNFAFSPTCIKVAKGSTVTFTNQDPAAHTVTGKTTDTFNQNLPAGQAATHTFNTSGTVDVVCTIHSSMLMTVIVQ